MAAPCCLPSAKKAGDRSISAGFVAAGFDQVVGGLDSAAVVVLIGADQIVVALVAADWDSAVAVADFADQIACAGPDCFAAVERDAGCPADGFGSVAAAGRAAVDWRFADWSADSSRSSFSETTSPNDLPIY